MDIGYDWLIGLGCFARNDRILGGYGRGREGERVRGDGSGTNYLLGALR